MAFMASRSTAPIDCSPAASTGERFTPSTPRPGPEGLADAIVFLADGTMVWTSISVGLVRARKGDEPVRVIARDLRSINSINVRKSDGRLFAAQVFGGDGVRELDPQGVKPPRN